MIIDSIGIKRYRSFEEGHASSCGKLNVLVGKNNSGKSNVLNAVDAFFCFLREQAPFTLSPRVGRDIDYFNRDLSAPIEISLTFLLGPSEAKELLVGVIDKLLKAHLAAAEAEKSAKKKVKEQAAIAALREKALAGLPAWRYLSVAISFAARPLPFGYLKDVIIMKAPESGSEKDRVVLLTVDSKAAKELRDQLLLANQIEKDTQIIDGILSTKKKARADKAQELSDADLSPYLEVGLSQATQNKVKEIYSNAHSFASFTQKVQAMSEKLKGEVAKTRQNPSASSVISPYYGNVSVVPNEVRQLILNLSKKKVLFIRETRKPLDETDAKKIFSLKSHRENDEDMRRIRQQAFDILGVEIDAYLNPSPTDPNAAEIDLNKILAQANGAGFRNILRLILDIGIEKPDLLLIEEPEIHLHPALERLVMRYLKQVSDNCQVFVTTHSSNFIDIPENPNIYLLSMERSSQIQLLDYEDAIAQISKELGIKPSSLFIYDNLVFVEGASDESILREWASTLGVSFSKANIGFVHMGGIRNLGYFAADSTISFLTKRQVRLWFVLDKDEKDSEEVSKICKNLGDRAKSTVLARRELENYLICPRAIADFVNASHRVVSPARAEDQTVSESQISDSLRDCAKALKEVAICKTVASALCTPLYFDRRWTDEVMKDTDTKNAIAADIDRLSLELKRRKDLLDAKYTECSKNIDSVWNNQWMVIVPGAILLERVCERYGIRYNKARDGPVLASFMRKSEIEHEIRTLLEEITASH